MAKARRAKKSKMPKKLLLVPVALIGIGTTIATLNTNTTISTTIGAQIETQEASNFVRDIFTEENTRYLPIVYTDPYEKITRDDLDREFRYAGMPIKSISTDTIGTGTRITTENATYTLLVYGDVDGNGEVNVRDVQAIVKHLLYGNGNELKGLSRIAANVDSEKQDIINVRDAQRIVQFLIGKKTIIDSIPTSDLIKDKEAPVITLNGEKEVRVKVFEKYEDNLGATVKDNLDPNVTVKVDTSRVNTSVPGEYEVIYTATDASGNQAQSVTRKVYVDDYIDGIEIAIYPKQHYVVGQVPDLSNMVAYPVYKYAGQGNEKIDVSKVSVTPTKITEDMIGDSQLTIEYEGKTKVIPIKVTEQVPVIELKTYNGSEDVKIRVNETYEEEDVATLRAYDEQDKKYYSVSISGTVDTTTPGEYIITYTSEPNSIEKVGKIERKVTVVDYITDVKFVVDSTKFLDTKTYLENDIIDITGITAKLTYATGKVETTDKLTYNKTAKYKEGDINQELVISYVAVDPIDPKISKTYLSTDNTYDIADIAFNNSSSIMIKVTKRFTTTKIVGTAKNSAGIYTDTVIATITEGPDEAPISAEALDIKVTPANADSHGCSARAWAVPSKTTEGAVDICFVGIPENNGTSPVSYTIAVTPKAEGGVTRNLAVVTEISGVVNEAQMDNAKIAGRTLANETEFQAGTTLTADLKFFHNYPYNGKNHSVEVNKVSSNNEVTVKVCEADLTTPVTGVTATLVKNSANVVTGINIVASDAATATDAGIEIVVVVDINNGATNLKQYINMTLYAKSRYTLTTNSSDSITLGYREGNFDGYEIKEIINGKYYTILPITISDQYSSKFGNRNITIQDLRNSIKFDIMKNGTTSYVSADDNIEVIGLNDSYSQVSTGITNIGIAIKGNEEVLEQAKEFRISFEDSSKIYDNATNAIVIKRKEVSSLQNTAWATGEYKGTGYCYSDISAVKVTSGEKQEKITMGEIKNIGYIIEKEVNGVKQPVLDILPSRDQFSSSINIGEETNSITANNATLKVGITTTLQNGVATVSVWAGNAGKYYVTPYYKTSTNKANTSSGITVNENMEVNAIKINGQAKNIGTAPVGSPKTFGIEFIHQYSDTSKTGKVEEGIVTNVSNPALSFNITGNIIEEIQMVAKSGNNNVVISYKKNSEGDYVSNSTYDNALVQSIRIFIKDGVELSGGTIPTEEFTIKIDHSKIVGSEITKQYSQKFVVGAEERLEIDHLNIGGTAAERNISIATTQAGANSVNANKNNNDNSDPISSQEIYKNPTDGLYYTMIPITFAAANNTPIKTRDLNAGLISSSIITKGDTTGEYVTFIDNSYETGIDFFADQTRLPVKGFKKQDNGTFVMKEGASDVIDYIGIAFLDSGIVEEIDEQDFLSASVPNWFNPEDWGVASWNDVRLREIKIYYKGVVIKTLNIEYVK